MKNVIVPLPKNDSLVAQLGSLYRTFINTKNKEDLEFDLSLLDWVCPLLVLPISAYINNTHSEYRINQLSKIKTYLETVNFPKGIDSISSFQRKTQKYKSYIPISILRKKEGTKRERLEALFSEKIYETLGNIPGAQNAVCYPIAELVTNIFEHSKKDTGFIFGQFYPNKNYLDICIVDCGRGFAGAYKEEKNLKLSDIDAITEVMKGNSVKSDRERGYGVWTSKKIICDVLNGGFIMISGAAGLVSENKKERLVFFPNFYWQGVIIAYRIPKPTGPLDISYFLE